MKLHRLFLNGQLWRRLQKNLHLRTYELNGNPCSVEKSVYLHLSSMLLL